MKTHENIALKNGARIRGTKITGSQWILITHEHIPGVHGGPGGWVYLQYPYFVCQTDVTGKMLLKEEVERPVGPPMNE